MRSIYWIILFFLVVNFHLGAQNSFTNLNGIPGGDIFSVNIDPASGKMYAFEGYQYYGFVSSDNGSSWTRFGNSRQYFRSFLIDGAKLYYTDYNSFYASSDGGTTWTRKSIGGFTNSYKGHMKKLPGNVFLNWNCDGVFVSTDEGVSWKKISNQSECGIGTYDVAYTSTGDVYFWTPNQQNLQRHTYPGDGIWDASKVTTVFTRPLTMDGAFCAGVSSTNKIYITYRNAGNTANIIQSSTTGNLGTFTTTIVNPFTADLNYRGNFWSRSPSGKLNLIAAGTPFELTNEATSTWTMRASPIVSNYAVFDITWKSGTEVYAATTGGGVTASTNSGDLWTTINGTYPNAINVPVGSDIEVLANGTIVLREDGGGQGVWTSIDQGQNFVYNTQTFGFNGVGRGEKLVKLQDNSIITSTNSGTRRTTDGINWAVQNVTSYNTYVPVSTNLIYGFADAVIGESSNLGVTFTPVTVSGLPSGGYFVDNAVYFNNSFVIAINLNSTNQMEYWKINTAVTPWLATKLVPTLSTASFSCGGIVVYGNKIYIGDRTKVAYSSDLTTWNTIAKTHNCIVPVPGPLGTSGVGIAELGNLMVTQDDGKNWQGYTVDGSICDLALDNGNTVYAASYAGPVAKYSGSLTLPPAELPPYVDPTWQSLKGPLGGTYRKLIKNPSGQLFTFSNSAIYRYNSSTLQWDRLINPGINDEISDVTIDSGGKMYLITSSQLFTSVNAGTTWTLTVTSSSLSSMKKILKVNSKLVIATGNGIRVSINDGSSFTTPVTAASGSYADLAVSTTNGLVASKYDGSIWSVVTSADDGLTWSGVSGIDLTNSKAVYSVTAIGTGGLSVVTSDNLYKSTNNGVTWNSIKGNLSLIAGNAQYRKVYLSPTNNQYYFSNDDGLYSSSDGIMWTKRIGTNFRYVIHDLIWMGTSMFAATEWEGVQTSDNDGNLFSAFQNNKGLYYATHQSLAFSEGTIFSTTCCGYFFKSTDDGQTFTSVPLETNPDVIAKPFADTLFALGGGISMSVDKGLTWVNQRPGDAVGYFPHFSAVANGNVITYYAIRELSGERKVVTSSNLNVWTVISAHIPYGVQSMAAAKDGAVYYTLYNDAQSYHELYQVKNGTTQLLQLGKEPESVHYYKGKIYVFSWAKILYETSDGVTWTSRATNTGGRMKVTKNGYFFIYEESFGTLILSRDQGKSWQSISGFGNDALLKIEIDETTGYAYAVVMDRPMQKSSTIMIPAESVAPVLSSRTPANDVNITRDFNITLTFSEAVKPISTKRVRLFESSNPNVPIETFEVQNGVKSNNGKTLTFTPTVGRVYLKQYFILVDNGAFTDIFGNSYSGITSSTVWTFTTQDEPDLVKPTITFTTSNLEKGTPKVFNVNVTDNKAILDTKFYYRGIAALETIEFTVASMSTTASDPITSGVYTLNVSDSWYDQMGLEFYIETEDKSGNKQRSPVDAGNYHYSYIDYGAAKPKLTGLTYGETVSSYRIISVPYKLIDPQVGTIFDELGEANNSKWRLTTYNGTDGYNEYSANDFSDVTRGKGYWIIMRNFTDIFVENATTPENNRKDFFSITLKRGWNQIGNPYTVPLSWEEVRDAVTDKVGELVIFKNGNYDKGDVLNAFEGGWVNALTETTLKVGFKGVASGGRKSAIGSDLNSSQWQVPINIKQGEAGNKIGGIGMNEHASLDRDRYDGLNPPAFVQRVELNFQTGDEVLAKSVVPVQKKYVWQFTAVAESNLEAAISWDNQDFGDNSKELFLVDEASAIVVNMRLQKNYTYAGGKDRVFKIYFGENVRDEIRSVNTLLGNPWPNPAEGTIQIPYSVSDASGKFTGRIELCNAMGMRISILQEGEFGPGIYNLEWNSDRNDIAQGLYFCRLIGHNQNGEVVNQVKKIILKR